MHNANALKYIKQELPDVDRAAVPVGGILRAAWKALAGPWHPDFQARVIQLLTGELVRFFASSPFKVADLGRASEQILARVFMDMMRRAGYARYTIQRLRSVAAGRYSRTAGLRSLFVGECFELLAQHLKGLQADLKSMAHDLLDDMVATLKGTAATPRPPLLDGNGNVMNLQGTFGPVRKLIDIIELAPGGDKLKFIDFMYVAEFIPADGSPKRLAILLEAEFKMPGAARGLRKQIGKALGRFTTADGITGVFEDGTPATYTRDKLIFSQAATTRTGISPGSTPDVRYVITTKGGYQEAFLRIKVEVDVDELYRLVNLLFTITK